MADIAALMEAVELFNKDSAFFFEDEMVKFTDAYLLDIHRSYQGQFCYQRPRPAIGLSEIGKPAILSGLKVIGARGEEVGVKSRIRFHYGDMFEALIVHLLRAYGLKITDTQLEVEYGGIKGHIDGILNDSTVIEIKTMSDRYYRQFLKQPDDERGYVTQLNMYTHLLGKAGVWVCMNKSTYEIAVIEMQVDNKAINRAKAIINVLPSLKEFTHVIQTFDAPEPVAEFFKKEPTGRYLLPECMKYSPYVGCFYETLEDLNGYKKPTTYVAAYQDELHGSLAYSLLMDYIPY